MELLTYYASLPLWGIVLGGNTLAAYIAAVTLFALIILILYSVEQIVLERMAGSARATPRHADDIAVAVIRSMRKPFYLLVAFFFSTRLLVMPELVGESLNVLLIVFVVYQAVRAAEISFAHVKRVKLADGGDDETRSAMDVVGVIIKGVVWSIGILLILSNLGVNVTSLVAGLGIGGIAIAFALQGILADLFSAFSIYFDKPFQVGDYIMVEGQGGVVTHIGIKTTRLRAQTGEEIVLSNKTLTAVRVQNFSRLTERWVSFTLDIVYDTPQEKLARIPAFVEEAVASVSGARFDRAHFKAFGGSALVFEIAYYVESPEYAEHVRIQHAVNMKLKRAFDDAHIAFAYPTQTLHIPAVATTARASGTRKKAKSAHEPAFEANI